MPVGSVEDFHAANLMISVRKQSAGYGRQPAGNQSNNQVGEEIENSRIVQGFAVSKQMQP